MDFEIIEDLSALDADGLREYISGAEAAARALTESDDAALEDIDRASAILDSRDAASEALSAMESAASERAERLAAARDRAGTASAAEDGDGEDEDEDGEQEPESTTASGGQGSALSRAASRSTKPPAPPAPRATIVAAADVPRLALGSEVASIADLAGPAADVITSLNRTSGKTRVEKAIADFRVPRSDGLVATAGMTDITELVKRAAQESRLPGGSLTAAGGWCAPSETIYDLCEPDETTEGIWDVPTIQVDRGGLNYSKGPQFSDFYGQTFISQTEGEAISGTEKSCVTITCPDFDEVRMGVEGVCISVPLLTQTAYPELVSRWISGTLLAHQHKMSVTRLTDALTIAGGATTVSNPWPTASGSLLAALELVVNGERQRYRLSQSATLEAVLPFWVKGALRADLSIRTGVDLLAVTDAMIDQWFALRGIRAQYVYGWQDLTVTETTTVEGDEVTTNIPATGYPGDLEVLVYPAGTFVAGTKDVITLRGVYDSAGLKYNTYTALFTEEGYALFNFCYEPRHIKIGLDITGLTAAALINQEYGTSAATPAAPPAIAVYEPQE